MRRSIHVLIALALVGTAGCGSTDASLKDSVIGTWETSLAVVVVFNDDGTYGVGHSVVSASPDDVRFAEMEYGTWSVEGGVLTKVTDEASRFCAGIESSYEIEVLDDGDRLGLTTLSDECRVRNDDFGKGVTRKA